MSGILGAIFLYGLFSGLAAVFKNPFNARPKRRSQS